MKIIEIIWLKLLLVNLISTSFFGENYDNLNKSIERYFFHAIFWGNSPYKKGWPLVLVHCTMKRSANKDDDGKKTHGRVRRGGNLHVITANGGSFPASMSLKPYYEASPKWPHTIFGIEDLIKVPSYWPFFSKMEVIHNFWRNCSIKCRKNTLFFRVLPGSLFVNPV